jgi:alpha-ketoglutarate-dependent taurine dioxygenase
MEGAASMATIDDCTISPLSAHTAAEVRGVDLAQPVDVALRERLNDAFVAHSVLVFRDQHLSPHQLLEAVQSFGEVFPKHNSRFSLPPLHLQPGFLSRWKTLHSGRGLPHRPLERSRTAEGDGPARGAAAGSWWRYAVRQHAARV